jgi:hypothetical protein
MVVRDAPDGEEMTIENDLLKQGEQILQNQERENKWLGWQFIAVVLLIVGFVSLAALYFRR